MADKFVELLKALLSPDNTQRQQAETMYQQAKASEPAQLLIGLLSVVGADAADESVRRQGAVLMRQLCSMTGQEKDYIFCKVAPEQKQQIATELLRRFEVESNPKLQRKVGEVVIKVADGATDETDQRGWLAPGQRGWPTVLPLIFRMSDCTTNPNVGSCESALRLLKDLVATFKTEVIQATGEIGGVLQKGFAHSDMKIKCATLLLVCSMVEVLDKKDFAPLMSTTAVMQQVMAAVIQSGQQDPLEECVQAYIDVIAYEPEFFKQQLLSTMEPAKFFSQVVREKNFEAGLRGMALEWIVSYVEKKPKFLAKSLPALPALALECCMEMMLEVEAGQEELEAWAVRMDDEEGEEDADELFHTGEEAVDRIAEAMGMDQIGGSLFALVGRFASLEQWQAKFAALAAIRQSVEYVEDQEHVNEMAKLLLAHIDHAHPRVRHMALHALGQLANDQSPHFQETFHTQVMPLLLVKMDDPVDRVAEMAMSAFVSFGDEMDNALMLGYSANFMQKLVSRLQNSSHRGIREESITSIAVIAGAIEKDFSQYYDGMMPILKQVVMNATGEKETRLRGKAFECMSLLGLAVGKQKFLPDAQEAISQILQVPVGDDDLLREYIKEASERICKCLGTDFGPFLPHLLPRIFKSLKLDGEDTNAKPKGDSDDTYITVSTGEGKLVQVNTSKFEELVQNVQLLGTFCNEMEGSYFDFVAQTGEALLPLLSATDEETMLCDEARSAAFSTWAGLIKCAREGAAQRNQPGTMAAELLRTFLQRICVRMAGDTDAETLKDAAEGIANCLKNVGPGVFAGQEALQLVQQLFGIIDGSLARTAKLLEEKKASEANAPPELQGDEDDEEDSLDDEENCRRACEEAIGSVMKAAPTEFLQCLTECGNRMSQWLATKQNKNLALWLACDLVQHLKEQSEPTWPIFMPEVLKCLTDVDADLRISAAYCVGLAAPLPRFAEAAPELFRRLAQIVTAKPPKKREEKGKVALDNAVMALCMLAKEKEPLCPPEVPAWQLVVSKLPLKEDEEEATKVHALIADLLLAQHAGLLGPDQGHLGKILSALAEVYHQESLCDKETDEKILRIFRMIPREGLVKVASSFTEKQQKKIEKMLSEA